MCKMSRGTNTLSRHCISNCAHHKPLQTQIPCKSNSIIALVHIAGAESQQVLPLAVAWKTSRKKIERVHTIKEKSDGLSIAFRQYLLTLFSFCNKIKLPPCSKIKQKVGIIGRTSLLRRTNNVYSPLCHQYGVDYHTW